MNIEQKTSIQKLSKEECEKVCGGYNQWITDLELWHIMPTDPFKPKKPEIGLQ